MQKDKYLVVWPKSEEVSHLNYHYTQFGECIDYLNNYFPNQIIGLDYDIEQRDINEFIRENNIKKVIMQVNYENAKNAFDMTSKIKEQNDVPIFAYGSIPIRLPELFKNSSFDLIQKAEGDPEVAIKSFIRFYDKNEEIGVLEKRISGAYILKDGELVNTLKGKFIKNEDWGMSRKEDVPIEKYAKSKGKDRYVINISRGCPFSCAHCLIQLTEGNMERRRDLGNLENAISEISKDYKHLKIWAANFTLNKEYVKKFCEMMKEKFPDMTWECATRIDLVKDEEMLKQMNEAGCTQISLGIESLNNDELIHTKKFKEHQISNAISNIQNSGIKVKGCVMLGMPKQNIESVVKTLKFLRDRNVDARPTIYTPYQELNGDNAKIEDLGMYNRKTYKNTNIKGISHEQLLELVKRPYEFEDILGLDEKMVEKIIRNFDLGKEY